MRPHFLALPLVALALALGLLTPTSPPEHKRPIHSALAIGLNLPGQDAPVLDLQGAELAALQEAQRAAEAEAARLAEIDRLSALEAQRLAAEQARINAPIAPARAPAGCGYEALIRATWPADQGDKAIQVAMRESGCTNTARNPSGASGLFQLMLPMHTGLFEAVGCSADQWADAGCNVRAAFALWQGSGWRPWGG